MNAIPPTLRRPDLTPLVAVCPEYAAAFAEYERLSKGTDSLAAAAAWNHLVEVARGFWGRNT